MRRALEVGDVRETLNMVMPRSRETLLARELRAEAMIASIQGNIKDDFIGDAYSEYKELLQILPIISDPALIEEIKDLSKQMNKALKE